VRLRNHNDLPSIASGANVMSSAQDPKGYYACLGLSPSASADEVKAAYRRLAKQLHPDVNQSSAANVQFQKINEAYQILGEADSRSEYDSLQYAKPKLEDKNEKLEPIHCSKCGKVTAQPRATAFFRVVSFMIMTIKTPTQGIFCSVCAKTIGIQQSLITSLFGWWGFPWGPIWTISSICTNAFGGRHLREVDERLVWYNAIAFFTQGQFAISYALARQSLTSDSAEISSKAKTLLEYFHARGISSPPLKNRWKNPSLTLAHIGLLLLVPGAIGAIFVHEQISRESTYHASPNTYPTRPIQTYIQPASQSANTPDLSKHKELDTSSLIPICSSQPHNGQLLINNVRLVRYGHSIQVKNGTSGNAIIKMRDAYSGEVKISFFVVQGGTASLSNIPDGTYRIQYAFGGELNADCKSFVRIASAAQFPTIRSLATEFRGDQVVTKTISYTLYTVAGGNVRPERIDPASF